MARCPACNNQIVFGGKRQNGHRYCNSRCAHKHEPIALQMKDLPPEILADELLRLHESDCPVCGRPGPVDIHNAHYVWSFIILTFWNSRPTICCQRCGGKRKAVALGCNMLFGWWGFPFGLIFTPIQIVRNLSEFGNPSPDAPSQELEAHVRDLLVESVDWTEFKKQEAIDEPEGWDAAEPV